MSITGQNLVDEIRSTSDLQRSQFCTDDELLLMTNEALSELFDLLVMTRDGYFKTSATLALTGSPAQANLPTDFYKELLVTAGTGAGLFEILPLESYRDRLNCTEPRYHISSRVITVYPISMVQPVTIEYVPNCPVLELADPMPVDMERFREYVAVCASIKVKAKRKQDANDLVGRLGQLRARVVTSVTGRNAGPKKVPMPQREQRTGWFDRTRRYLY